MTPSPALPPRWRPWQRRKNTAILRLVRLAVGALRALPGGPRRALGRALGHLAWALARPQRRLAQAQLTRALPALDEKARRRTVRQMFVHLGESAAELLDLPALVRASPLEPENEAVLRTALAGGRGVLAVAGHLGNWELLAQAVAARGIPLAVVAKPLYDPRLTAWVDAERRRFGAEVLWRGGAGEVRPVLRALSAGKVIALLLDQDTRVAGVHVPFFHAPAHTPSAAAALALRYGTPVVLASTWREGRRHRYRLVRLDVAAVLAAAPQQAPVVALTAAFAAHLEAAVRARPAQWVWFHARWRRRPAAAAAAAPPFPASARPTVRNAAMNSVARVAAAGTVLAAVATALAASAAAARPAPTATRPSPPPNEANATPLPPAVGRDAARAVSFRCDGLQLRDRGRSVRCRGNVVLREGGLLLCCNALDARADADWRWQAVQCVGDVRLAQQDAQAWAQRADYAPEQRLVTLRGAPQLRRGLSVLHGELVRLSHVGGPVAGGAAPDEVEADVERPRGALATADAARPSAKSTADGAPDALPDWAVGPLPAECPLPPAPGATP